MVGWIGAHQRAARISRHAFAQPAEHGAERLPESFALDVPQRHVDGRDRQREDPARTRACRRRAQLVCERVDAQRIFANHQFAELISGLF